MTEKKREIINVACEALQRGGVNGFSFRDLAETVGIKSSSVHYHFRNKNELFKAIVEEFRNTASENLAAIDSQATSLKEAVLALVEVFEDILDEGKFCVCGMLAADQKHLDEDVIEELNLTFRDLESWLVQTIEKYPAVSLPADSLATLLISSLEGSMLIDRVSGEKRYFASLRKAIDILLG
ncbi:MAG: TetR/AcrR family transcriptional regulator [Lentisphaeraceae bacterium]|nr:TetR/AcrR family transcriptional regulator [Lentisphaeraceae bacterium]